MPELWEIEKKKVAEHVVNCWDAAVNSMSEIDQINTDMINLYRGIHTSRTSPDYNRLKSRIFLPIPRIVVKQALPRIMSGLFPDAMPFKLVHRGVEDRSVAEAHYDLATMQLTSTDKMNFYIHAKEYVLDALMFTHAVGIVYWDTDRQTLVFRTVDCEDCRPAPGARNLDDAEYWITRTYASSADVWKHIQRMQKIFGRSERFFATNKRLIDRLPKATMRNEQLKPFYAQGSMGDDTGTGDEGKSEDTSGTDYSTLLANPTDKMIEVLTFRSKTHWVEFVRTKNTKSKAGNTVKEASAVLLRYDNPFSEIKKGSPKPAHVGVFSTALEELPRCIVGTAPLSLIDHLTRQANTLTNMRMDNLKGIINSTRFIDTRSGIDEKQLKSKPLGIVWTNGPPAQYIHDAAPPNVTDAAVPEIERLIGFAKEVMSVTQYHQGMNQPSGRTPTSAINRLLAEGDMPMSQWVRNLKQTLIKPLAQVMIRCNERFIEEDFATRVFGPSGRYIIQRKREHLKSKAGIDVVVEEPELLQDKQLLQSNLVGLMDVLFKGEQMGMKLMSNIKPEGFMRWVMKAFTRKPSEADEVFQREPNAVEADQTYLANIENAMLAEGNEVPVLPFHEAATHLPIHQTGYEDAEKDGDDLTRMVFKNHIVAHQRDEVNKAQMAAMQGMMGGQGGEPPEAGMGMDVEEALPQGAEI